MSSNSPSNIYPRTYLTATLRFLEKRHTSQFFPTQTSFSSGLCSHSNRQSAHTASGNTWHALSCLHTLAKCSPFFSGKLRLYRSMGKPLILKWKKTFGEVSSKKWDKKNA